jgi:hypothetical protein
MQTVLHIAFTAFLKNKKILDARKKKVDNEIKIKKQI